MTEIQFPNLKTGKEKIKSLKTMKRISDKSVTALFPIGTRESAQAYQICDAIHPGMKLILKYIIN